MVSVRVETVLDVVATFTLVAPELERAMFPDFDPEVAVAAKRK